MPNQDSPLLKLYQPSICDLEKDAYQNKERPVVYVDDVIELLAAEVQKAEEKGKKYSLSKSINDYLAGGDVDTMTIIQGFVNMVIAITCIDTNSTEAEVKIEGLTIKGRPIGDWKIKVTQLSNVNVELAS